jgi:hypothetical protein
MLIEAEFCDGQGSKFCLNGPRIQEFEQISRGEPEAGGQELSRSVGERGLEIGESLEVP